MAENGRLPDSALAPVPGHPNARLTAAAAEAFGRVRTGVQAAYGWTPAITSDADAYRRYEIQERIFRERYTAQASGSGPYGDVRFWNGVRYVRTTGAAAAVPGTSNHGWGIAVDIADIGGFGGTRFSQFKAVAEPIGWSNTEGRSVNEPWHWTFGKPSTTPDPTPTPIPSEEDDMPWFFRRVDGAIAIVTPTGVRSLTLDQWSVWENLGLGVFPAGMGAMDYGPFDAVVQSLGGWQQ